MKRLHFYAIRQCVEIMESEKCTTVDWNCQSVSQKGTISVHYVILKIKKRSNLCI